MAGDTLRGIGRKAIAEAIEAAAVAERAAESNGTAPASAVTLVNDAQARPERSLDELPSERTGYPAGAPAGSAAGAPRGRGGPGRSRHSRDRPWPRRSPGRRSSSDGGRAPGGAGRRDFVAVARRPRDGEGRAGRCEHVVIRQVCARARFAERVLRRRSKLLR